MRPVVVEISGSVTGSLPSLGVFEASVIGQEFPPSVDSKMLTLFVLIGAAVVPATFQVTVREP